MIIGVEEDSFDGPYVQRERNPAIVMAGLTDKELKSVFIIRVIRPQEKKPCHTPPPTKTFEGRRAMVTGLNMDEENIVKIRNVI